MKKTLLALALIGASTTAFADSWIYGGASVGQSDLNGETATSMNVHAGTGILPFIGVEAGYTDHGDFGDVSANSVYFALKPSIDFGPLHIYGRGGLHSWNTEFSNGKKDDGVDIMYSVGAEYFIMGPFSIGASYSNYELDGDNIDSFSLNTTFHFL